MKANTQSGRRDFLDFFFPLLCREEILHHMSSCREVSEEATQTFTAQCVPSLLPAHRYKLFTSHC